MFAQGGILCNLRRLFSCRKKPKFFTKKAQLEEPCRLCRINRQGAAAVEFALIAPLFFFLVLGMIELGRAVMVQQVLTNASREGARMAILDDPQPNQSQRIKNFLKDYLAAAGIPGVSDGNITISPDPPNTAKAGEPVRVTVRITYGQVSWLPMPRIRFNVIGSPVEIDMKSKQLSATTTMRRETVQ